MRTLFNKFILIGIFLLTVSSLGCATTTVYDAHTEVELVSENRSILSGSPFWVALRMKMDPTWHVYWRNPGDSGLPPKIVWNLPEGFSAGEIQWPRPKRYDASGLTTYIYEPQVFLLTQIIPPKEIDTPMVDLKAQVQWLACEVPCIPGKADLTLNLPVARGNNPAIDPKWQDDFQLTKAQLPVEDKNWNARVSENDGEILLEISAPGRDAFKNIQFFPFDSNLIVHSAPQNFETKANNSGTLHVQKNARGSLRQENLQGILVIDEKRAVSIDLPIEPGVPAPATTPNVSLLGMLLFAFLGGIILNLMPCVFPVLSIKVLALVNHSKEKTSLVTSAVGFTLGVVGTFAALAFLLIVLKEGGQALGWGFQFQSPYFVVGMTILLFVMALNFFGLFEWSVSVGVSTKAAQSHFGESFFNGVLAVIVATPCTAPFMGTALGFALTQSNVVNLLIFVFLGLGMAFPFGVLLLTPSLIKMLPKPGVWMDNFKKFLGFPLLATDVWLLWVLSGQKGPDVVVVTLGGLLLIGFGFWLKNITGHWGKAAAVVLIIAGIIMPFKAIASAENVLAHQSVAKKGGWVPYDVNFIEEKKNEGRIIFIDFTARWCLTCQVNKRVALKNDKIERLFQEKNVVTVEADWTNRDETITQALVSFGKNSVPVYVVLYSEGGSYKTKILPEILTPHIIMEHLNNL